MNLKIYKPTLKTCRMIQAMKGEKVKMIEKQKGAIEYIKRAANLGQKTSYLL